MGAVYCPLVRFSPGPRWNIPSLSGWDREWLELEKESLCQGGCPCRQGEGAGWALTM